MCAGLEAALRLGMRVRRYLYFDTSPAAEAVACKRMHQLHAAYPALLPASAFASVLTAMPMDVRAVTRTHLQQAGAGAGET
jgi:hypothetical protein